YVIAQTPRLAALAKSGLGQAFQQLGRHSLAIFALGSVLSCLGQATLSVAEAQFSLGAEIVGPLYTLFGIMGLFLFVRYLEWNKLSAERRLVPAGNSLSTAWPASPRPSS
ncbi:MAG TPA: OpgC domain-containing protein, partial [Roseiarcus sp.]|nr:OpgC domain-containing protein [Roseiarcus sp.]